MGPTPWSSTLDTGNSELDEQHRDLFRLHMEALDGVRRGKGRSPSETLSELLERTRQHFAYEMKVMEEAGYPQREAHGKDHEEFMRDLVSLVGEGAREPASAVVRLWLESRYASWWSWHVRSSDAALARYLTAAAAPPPG